MNRAQSLEKYHQIFETPPIPMVGRKSLELHMLVCQRDFLRSFWALKSFFYYARIPATLVIQNDGSLSSEQLDCYQAHFPGCIVNTDNDDEVESALAGYPTCQFFLRHHAIAKKLFHPLLLSKSRYLLIMDSDILWFKRSRIIQRCVQNLRPFYVEGGAEAYVRNRNFMEQNLDLFPANNVNTGIIGYSKARFLNLPFIEAALNKLIHIPKESIVESIGYRDTSVDAHSSDINRTLCWWVMEQTIYALLMGREPQRQMLKNWSNQKIVQLLGDLHQFTNTPIMRGTALIHYISDSANQQFFPSGVEHLIRRSFQENCHRRQHKLHA